MIYFKLLLFFQFILSSLCLNFEIFISNNAIFPYLGTEANPFPTLYSAFTATVAINQFNATPLDSFHFKIVPIASNNIYLLDDSEISVGNLFHSFLGILLHKINITY